MHANIETSSYAKLVDLDYFKEVKVGILLIGPIHFNKNQWSSCTLHLMKGDDVNLLLELLGFMRNYI
jgi:hypothetical protein